jgi:hypothetical protein
MGTGAFNLKRGKESREFIIKAGPPLKEFNELLAQILSKSGASPSPFESPEGPFPIFPGAVSGAKGATSLQPGRNYQFSVYTTDKAKEEVVRFYETRLKDYQRSDESDGSVKFSMPRGSLRLSGSAHQTRIEITQGPY